MHLHGTILSQGRASRARIKMMQSAGLTELRSNCSSSSGLTCVNTRLRTDARVSHGRYGEVVEFRFNV